MSDRRSSGLPAPHAVRRRGFSALELVFVIAILVILTGMAVPSTQVLGVVRRDMARERVGNVLRYAHSVAMNRERFTWVRIDRATNLVTAFVEDPSNPGLAGRVPLLDPLTLQALVLDVGAAGGNIEKASFDGTVEVGFDAEGTPTSALGAPLASTGAAQISGLLVEVVDGTGLVRTP